MSKEVIPSASGVPRGLLTRRGAPSGLVARLPTIRNPRDLTLGGGAPKKSFTPNIPARRNKEETKEIEEKATESKQNNSHERRERKDGQRGRGRGRMHDNNIIQTHSIFEEGPAAEKLRASAGAHYGGGGGGGGGGGDRGNSFGSRQAIKREKVEDTDMDSFLRDDFVAYKDNGEDYLDPISLPLLSTSTSGQKKPYDNAEVKESDKKSDDIHAVQVKKEAHDGIEDMEVDEQKNLVDGHVNVGPESALCDLFRKSNAGETNKQFILFQLPEVLPLNPPEKNRPRQPAGSSQSSMQNGTSESRTEENQALDNSKKQEVLNLSEFPDGPIGKLRVHKSGRVTLVFGGLSLDVSQGTPVGYLQELVSLHLNNTGGGDMCVLGQVTDKLICSPQFESLLDNR